MHPQLDAIVGDLQSAQARLQALRATLSYDAWYRRPGESTWSAAECLAHLNLSSSALLPLLRAGIEQAGVRGNASYRRDPLGWLIGRVVTPAGGLRTRTPAAFVPSGEPALETLAAEFERMQADIITCVRAADGRAIDRVMIESPFARVRYNLFSAMTLVPRHQHRHLQQAERAAQVGVPAASPVTA